MDHWFTAYQINAEELIPDIMGKLTGICHDWNSCHAMQLLGFLFVSDVGVSFLEMWNEMTIRLCLAQCILHLPYSLVE